MEKEKISHGVEECPVTAAMDIIGGKWKPPILWLLRNGALRFGELNKALPRIALKVLSKQLKELEADGLITRMAYPEIPPRVEYSLSAKGESLCEVLTLLSDWSKANILQ
jgi:DNA-binding HxlR family transcriptional regulator